MMEDRNCRQLLGSLSEYVDGTLEQALCEEIERHLGDCQDCQIVVDTLQKTVYLYHNTADEFEVPESVRERLYRRLDLNEYLKKKKQ